MNNSKNSQSSKDAHIEARVNKHSDRVSKLANMLLSATDQDLQQVFGPKEELKEYYIPGFSEFLLRVKNALKRGNIQDFEALLEIRDSIKDNLNFTQQQVELVEKYGLQHLKGANIQGRTLTEIRRMDMRNVDSKYVKVKGHIIGSVFSDITLMTVAGDIAENKVGGNMEGYDSKRNNKGNQEGYISENNVGKSIYRNKVGGDLGFNQVGNDISQNIVGGNMNCNTTEQDIIANKVGRNMLENQAGENMNHNSFGGYSSDNTAKNL